MSEKQVFESTDRNARLSDITYRSGAAARLAGLPVETLRVWERRYGLSDPQRSSHGQRLYSAEQVQRLRLLKQLVDLGHPIGQLAGHSIDRLRELAGIGADGRTAARGPISVVAVGIGLAHRLAVGGNAALQLDILASHARLEQVAPLPDAAEAAVLLVELSELDESALPRIAAARDAVRARAVTVLYRFCASATIRALRAQGWVVARVPAELGELLSLCRTALDGQRLPLPAQRSEPAPPRFDEEALARLSVNSGKLACECPRHLTELLLMVGSFERYSAQCASRDSADAELHHALGNAAAQARVVLEDAMEQLARAEGLALPRTGGAP
ncbi:MerR family transcriptional regulator [Massilia sp.]|uniref:MerR family transcriptional regulator n=1 Tax=Massilia sp. TaxID=1882437 RepID=UPI0028AA1F85|nr:MerR family transcriptional regulator [Massilia sp.]